MIKQLVITASYWQNNNSDKTYILQNKGYLLTTSKVARLFIFIAITIRRPSVCGTSCIKMPGNITNIFGLGLIANLPAKIIGALSSSTSRYTTQLNSEGK